MYQQLEFVHVERRVYMLSKIDLKNYKSYNNSSIELHPITVLCGGNSSGKTSIIKSILMMKQSFEATGNNYLLINGPYTNNGLFANVRRTQSTPDSSKICISLSFVLDKQNPLFKDICKSIGMSRRKDYFHRFEIRADFQFAENLNIPQIGEIEESTITLTSVYNEISNCDSKNSIQSRIHMVKCGESYTIELNNFPTPLYLRTGDPFVYMDHMFGNSTCYFRGMQLVSLYSENLSKKATSALPVLYTIFRSISSELDKIEYIGPLRETPLRQYFLQNIDSEIGVKGENTANYLGQYGESIITTFLPNQKGPQDVTLNDAVAQWASFLGIEKVSVCTSRIPGANVTQIMIGDQNIVDVGFGISQVLPILVEGLTMHQGSMLILEQPEIHLHPKMQMDIADFLIMLAQQGKHLIIETHSDHIINRIVRRAVENCSLRDMIGIYFVEKDNNGDSQLTKVLIDEDLGIDEAPKGFFDQYASETEEILQAGYTNMRTKRGGLQ